MRRLITFGLGFAAGWAAARPAKARPVLLGLVQQAQQYMGQGPAPGSSPAPGSLDDTIDQSFPASDPGSSWAGKDTGPR